VYRRNYVPTICYKVKVLHPPGENAILSVKSGYIKRPPHFQTTELYIDSVPKQWITDTLNKIEQWQIDHIQMSRSITFEAA